MIPANNPLTGIDYNNSWKSQFFFGNEIIGRNKRGWNFLCIFTVLPCQFFSWISRVSPDEIDKVSSIAFPTMFALFNVKFLNKIY